MPGKTRKETSSPSLAYPKVWESPGRKGQFHPKIRPYLRRTSLELWEAILALYACGAFYSP